MQRKGRGGRPPRALPAASVQTDPVVVDYDVAYSPPPDIGEGDRTPVATPERLVSVSDEEAMFGDDTFSPIAFEGEAVGTDPSALEALASIRRVNSPDGDGDHEEAADAIAEGSAFRTRNTEPGDE